MSSSDTAARIAAVAATIHTVGQARACLGKTADILHEAYDRVGDITGSDNAAAARELLDQANGYAQRVYGDLPADDARQADEVSATMSGRVGGALGTSLRAIRRVEDAAGATYWDYFGALDETLQTVGGGIGKGIQRVTNAVAGGAWAFARAAWPTLVVVAAVIGALLWLRFRRRTTA